MAYAHFRAPVLRQGRDVPPRGVNFLFEDLDQLLCVEVISPFAISNAG